MIVDLLMRAARLVDRVLGPQRSAHRQPFDTDAADRAESAWARRQGLVAADYARYLTAAEAAELAEHDAVMREHVPSWPDHPNCPGLGCDR